MGTELEELLIQLKADNEEFKSALKSSQGDLNKATDAMTRAVEDFSKKSQGGFRVSQMAFASFVGNIASDLTQKALGAIFDLGKALISEGVQGAIEAEKASALLGNAFRLAGMDAETSTKQFKAFAEGLASTTAFEDDTIVKTGAMIQSLARLDQEGLQRATAAAANFAAATGKDISEVTQAVGKAMGGQISALSRLGIHLEDTGSKSKNAALALETLEARFGGSAQAAVRTFAGALSQSRNAFGDMAKEVGNLVVQNPVVIAGLNQLTKIFREFKEAVSANSGELQYFVSAGLIFAVDAATLFLASLDQIMRAIEGTIEVLGGLVQGLVDTGQAFYDLVTFAGLDEVKKDFEETGNIVDAFKETISGDSTLSNLGVKTAELSQAMEKAFDPTNPVNFKKKVDETNDTLGTTAKELTAAQEAAKAFGEALLKKSQDPNEDFKARSDLLKASREQDIITDEVYFQQKNEMLAEQFALENQMLQDARATSLQSETDYNAASLQLAQQQTAAKLALAKEENDRKKELDKERTANISSSLSAISSLQNAHSKELVAVGRAAGTAEAIISGQVAIQKAWAVGGPFGAVLAAGVAAATAVQIARIQGVQLAGGVDSVPGFGNRDSVPAMLTPGERVVPKNTNADLKDFLANQNEPRTVVNNTFNISADPNDGEKLVRIINDALSRGAFRGAFA